MEQRREKERGYRISVVCVCHLTAIILNRQVDRRIGTHSDTFIDNTVNKTIMMSTVDIYKHLPTHIYIHRAWKAALYNINIHSSLDAFVNFDFMVINDGVENTDDVVNLSFFWCVYVCVSYCRWRRNCNIAMVVVM